MQNNIQTVDDYLQQAPLKHKDSLVSLRNIIIKNLPPGFQECLSYGMIGYVVPHTLYPHGYHCNPELPLPFASLASQKNFISFYHMGLYAIPTLYDWFMKEYTGNYNSKLDMGKSCIRFKKMDQIPFTLIGELIQKVSVQEWIEVYERQIKR